MFCEPFLNDNNFEYSMLHAEMRKCPSNSKSWASAALKLVTIFEKSILEKNAWKTKQWRPYETKNHSYP